MEIKRFTPLMFFLFASMLLLAHAVLPHYHHDRMICFTPEKQCFNLFNNDSSSACCNKHMHQETHQHDFLDDCDLNKFVIRQDQSLDHELIPSLDTLSLSYTLYSLNTFFLEAPEFSLTHQEKPYLNNYTSSLYGLDLNLRGPPIYPIVA